MIDDDTHPHDISELLPLMEACTEPQIGVDLVSPRGHCGYVAGRSFEDEGVLLFVLHLGRERTTTVGVRREHLRGWRDKKSGLLV